jgi:hypothetical protein
MIKSIVVSLIVLMLALAAGFGWNYYHQRSLSPEVGAAVLAALGDNTTFADASAYLRAAKPASRTKRDFDVVGRLDRAVVLGAASQEHSRQSWDLLMKGIKFDPTPPICSYHDQKAMCIETLSAQLAERKQNARMQEIYEEDSKREKAEAEGLITQLRVEMRLPALPTQK